MSVVMKVALGIGAYMAFVAVVLTFFAVARRTDDDTARLAREHRARVEHDEERAPVTAGARRHGGPRSP